MTAPPTPARSTMQGAYLASLAVAALAVGDAAIKFLSDAYALHQVVLIRSAIGLALVLTFVMPFAGGLKLLRTTKLRLHLMRGTCLVIANMTFFTGLAAMPLAEAVAIFFVSPLLITVFAVFFLGETVGPWRWGAVGTGLIGVLIILRPGTEAFQLAALLPLFAAAFYATIHIFTRRMAGTESAVTMVIYMQSVFILVSGVVGFALGHGQFDRFDDPSLQFLLRAWTWPATDDLWIFGLIGLVIACAGLLISQAYRVSEATFVAPFEYIAMPLSILFGIMIFDEYPDLVALGGAALILSGGFVLIWREARARKALAPGEQP